MAQVIVVNLAVKDCKKATDFYLGLGYTKNDNFSDDEASAIVVSESIIIMLLEHKKLAQFTSRPIADTTAAVWGTVAFSCEQRADVDTLAGKALALGATADQDPQDHGFMYGRGFYDLDGHAIELFWMNPDMMPAG